MYVCILMSTRAYVGKTILSLVSCHRQGCSISGLTDDTREVPGREPRDLAHDAHKAELAGGPGWATVTADGPRPCLVPLVYLMVLTSKGLAAWGCWRGGCVGTFCLSQLSHK